MELSIQNRQKVERQQISLQWASPIQVDSQNWLYCGDNAGYQERVIPGYHAIALPRHGKRFLPPGSGIGHGLTLSLKALAEALAAHPENESKRAS
jgi:hypothetical protein